VAAVEGVTAMRRRRTDHVTIPSLGRSFSALSLVACPITFLDDSCLRKRETAVATNRRRRVCVYEGGGGHDEDRPEQSVNYADAEDPWPALDGRC